MVRPRYIVPMFLSHICRDSNVKLKQMRVTRIVMNAERMRVTRIVMNAECMQTTAVIFLCPCAMGWMSDDVEN